MPIIIVTMVTRRQLSLCRKRKASRKKRTKAVVASVEDNQGAKATEEAATALEPPTEVGLNSALEQALLRLTDAERPENTKRAYDAKVTEYFEYCDACYNGQPYKYIVNSPRLYRFFWYLAFREKTPPGKRGGSKIRP